MASKLKIGCVLLIGSSAAIGCGGAIDGVDGDVSGTGAQSSDGGSDLGTGGFVGNVGMPLGTGGAMITCCWQTGGSTGTGGAPFIGVPPFDGTGGGNEGGLGGADP
jgi:hypothetical protein